MTLNNGYGRPKFMTKFKSVNDYLENHIFVVKDNLFKLQDDEKKKEKAYNAARAKANFCRERLERAYEGLEHFRK